MLGKNSTENILKYLPISKKVGFDIRANCSLRNSHEMLTSIFREKYGKKKTNKTNKHQFASVCCICPQSGKGGNTERPQGEIILRNKNEKIAFIANTITKSRLYNFYPNKPHYYIVKLGFTGVFIIFSYFAKKHRLWVLVRTASPRRF